MAPRPTFSLRFTNPDLRKRVRMLAEQCGISQNEFLERAAEHEVIARSGLLSSELEALASRLGQMSASTLRERVEASKADFVAGEALPDPLRPRLVHLAQAPAERSSLIGAVAAFGHA